MERSFFHKVETTVGSLKFAVIAIAFFTVAMITGTFLESYHGAAFAGKMIYKSTWFMGLQLFIFLSIFIALLVRLPPVKRLYGFYIVHIGLIMVGCGSFITYYAGIDGSITLTKNSAVRDVVLPEMMVTIESPDSKKVATLELPTGGFSTSINKSYNGVTLNEYIPFASNSISWESVDNPRHDLSSTEYLLFNNQTSQELTFTTYHLQEEFPTSMELGPLGVHYLAESLKTCFTIKSKEGVLLWNSEELSCTLLSDVKNAKRGKTNRGNLTVTIDYKGKTYNFFPDFTPWPITDHFQMDTSSPIRMFNKSQFEKGPNLFLFGKSLTYFYKGEWSYKNFDDSNIVELPWMGFKIKLNKHSSKEAPFLTPVYRKPMNKNGEVVEGKLTALSFTYNGKKYWTTSEKPGVVQTDKGFLQVTIHNRTIPLPFEFVLTRFKMDTDPGTNRPASFESFVQLFTENGPSNHHVYMNNPLKFGGFTFYQSSYFQDNNGDFGSVLSVNVDPGRWLKYLGSLLLVLGAALHYIIRMKRIKMEL